MTDAAAEFDRGLTALNAGDQSQALSGFLMALDPETPAHRQKALETLGTSVGYTTLPQPVLDGLARCTEDPVVDLQPLALVVKTLLEHHAMRSRWLDLLDQGDDVLEHALADGVFDSILTDPIIRAVLNTAINISLDLEDILTSLRRHGLSYAVKGKTSVLLDRHRMFFEALSTQAERTDFAWAESEEEDQWLENVSNVTDGQLILSAYRHVTESPIPAPMALTRVSDAISLKVQSQYAAYPYPRWERLSPIIAKSLYVFLAERFPKESWLDRFKESVNGLSAGCGTDRGALQLARSIEGLALTAVDLSASSLTFANGKTKDLGIANVAFGLADILELPSLERRFDVIESSGVLHHMDDPAAGLKALCRCLAPDGVMRLALYSERAHASVVAARQ